MNEIEKAINNQIDFYWFDALNKGLPVTRKDITHIMRTHMEQDHPELLAEFDNIVLRQEAKKKGKN